MSLRKPTIFIALLIFTSAHLSVAQAVSYKVSVELAILSKETYADDEAQATEWCTLGVNEYKIAKGDPIKFKNESGKTVGIGKLSKAFAIEDEGSFYCGYTATVTVGAAKFYSVTIDGREGPDYSFAELKKKKWKVSLYL